MKGVFVERRIWRARAGESDFHFSRVVSEARIAWKEFRAWEAESDTGRERESGLGGYVAGVDAFVEGEDRGLGDAEPVISASIRIPIL